MLTSDPVILFSPDGRRSKRFAAIDALGWIRAGWSLVPIEKVVVEEAIVTPPEDSPGTIPPEIPSTLPPSKSEGKKK